MRWPFHGLFLSTLLAADVLANDVKINQDNGHRQQCSGMYGKKAWGGNVDPYIQVKLLKLPPKEPTPLMSLVIFEWKDEGLIGRFAPDDKDRIVKETICDPHGVKIGLCDEKSLGAFILEPNATKNARFPLISMAVNLTDPQPIKYLVKKSGFYCVSTYGFTGDNYNGIVSFRNAYGELAGPQIPKLAFYGGLTLIYAVIGIFWAFLYVQHRHDILPVQNYITAILVFLVVEQLMTWGFYDYQNRHGMNGLARVLMVIVAILNAGRNSFSFFLLLIVCMGYGVVKPSLGRTMVYVRCLAIGHFVFGVVYGVASLSITPDSAGPLVLLVVLPLAGTLTAFYVWTLNSLGATMKDLIDRKQRVKAMMYKKLWWCILGSIMVTFGFFFLNSFLFASKSVVDYIPDHWKTRWFVLDGWLNIVYLFDIGFVAYLWRPTANNRRFAMSDEVAQDDDGFEIRSIASSLDEEEELGEPPNSRAAGVAPSAVPGAATLALSSRQSLDADHFAVGDERWSDDESPRNSTEGKGLMRKED
ncbi:Membrane protein ptm1 [Ophidiomyces ophidiicola]|uniref:Membrane protein ptm1 n=1 Tax=Ophidiomyces ophidiicola TaxID=1387563 RepID=UPI0020C4D5B9|nr:Membrane protein ptm1 [Ophidiomyces ophidiicola]KAI1938870.1 Membrane protein ptm1 [Ophidiomyces ophidiicola]KAI2060044.1 Membrane protein ptm1 [Ophidiomyces ophidiicola]